MPGVATGDEGVSDGGGKGGGDVTSSGGWQRWSRVLSLDAEPGGTPTVLPAISPFASCFQLHCIYVS